MPSVINTNIASVNTQRNLGASQAALSTTIQRLSTGLRVNSAKDDAAGLAIAERMNAQVRGLNVAARNASDGVSLAQTAEGALGKVGDMVQRIRELAVQSSNATNSAADRAALQSEVTQLTQEIDRVATTTNFNGTKLLNGSFTAKQFQVGADAGQSITVASITDAQLSGMGGITTASVTGAAATAFTALAAGDLQINGVAIGAVAAGGALAAQASNVAAAINLKSDQTGVTATVNGSNQVVLASSLRDITIAQSGGASAATTGLTSATTALSTTTSGSMSTLDISSYLGAQEAIRRADSAMDQVNTARANLGALQSRFENAVSNIQIASENTTAARSRIMDTDFAAETANLTRAQILQQAGNAMLSQANQLPQQVLSLLR